MKKAIVNLICFPFLFLFFTGKSIATALGQKDNQALPIAFVVAVCLGVVLGAARIMEEPQGEIEVPEGENPGVYFIPAGTENAAESSMEKSVVDHTMLESAIIQFHQKHGRVPKDMAEFQASGVMPGLPAPKEGFEYRLNLEMPEILQVPIGTKAAPTEPGPK